MKEELKNTLNHLQKPNTILYPTDTIWGIGCDATNEEAVKKVYQLKQRDESKALICLVNSFEMLSNYITNMPEEVSKILDNAEKPTTIIYNNPKHLAKNLIAADNTIAFRLVNQGFCFELIESFGKPIVSTSANISGEASPKHFSEISKAILTGVDYVVNLPKINSNSSPSRIIKLNLDGSISVIRD